MGVTGPMKGPGRYKDGESMSEESKSGFQSDEQAATTVTATINLHIGNYRLVRALKRGGFATVYLGEHVHLNTPAAIKIIHKHDSCDVARFQTEARLHANMHHSHIVRV